MRSFAWLVFLTVAVFVAGVYLYNHTSQPVAPTTEQVHPRQKLVQAENISFTGNWIQGAFPKGYYHAYDVMVPEGWLFITGGDAEGFSAATVAPGPVVNAASPQISVIDFAPITCPKSPYFDCELDEFKKVSISQYYERQKNSILERGAVVWIQSGLSVKETNITKPTGVTDMAVFAGIHAGVVYEFYFFKGKTGVIGAAFENAERFSDGFKAEFLRRLVVK